MMMLWFLRRREIRFLYHFGPGDIDSLKELWVSFKKLGFSVLHAWPMNKIYSEEYISYQMMLKPYFRVSCKVNYV